MALRTPHHVFSSEDQIQSTLQRIQDMFGNWTYTLKPIYHDATTQPLAITPNDPMFNQQWHLNGTYGINVQTAWNDYRGEGITIGFVDDGAQYTHPDLSAHYNTAIDYDLETNTNDGAPRKSSDNHGTTTSGVAGAAGDNGQGITGVAWEATETMMRLPFGSSLSDAQFASLYVKQLAAGVDISSNSWGFGGFFGDDFGSTMPQFGAAIEDLAQHGRGGLGTAIVFAAGNGREDGQDTNYHSLNNSQYTISVGAIDSNGKVSVFSTPGESVLVAAPGRDITSTDRTGSAGYVNGDYVTGLAGTSYSAPIVSGVVALMLDANPNLGYRDVQEILAMSARNSDTSSSSWHINGADNWNGGGMHFSRDYGFGLVDATAATRLAESWQGSATYDTRDMINGGMQIVNSTIPNNNATGISRTLNVNSDITIDRVEVDLNIDHNRIGDLIVTLTSPTGMVSTLINRPGVVPGNSFSNGSSQDDIHFTLNSNAFWGETGNGTWTLKVSDNKSSYTGTLQNWGLRLYGDTDSADDIYYFTNEYSEMRATNAARGTLSDASGVDMLNLAAVSADTVLSLVSGTNSTIDGAAFSIAGGTVIENAWLGDGNDSVTGNNASNQIWGARGDDTILGGAGNDTLDGGAGIDTAHYSGLYSDYGVSILNSFTLSIIDLVTGNGDEGTDSLLHFEKLQFADGLYLFNGASVLPPGPPPTNFAPDAQDDTASLVQDGSKVIAVLANDSDPENDTITVSAITVNPGHGSTVINPDNTITYTPAAGYFGPDNFTYEINDGHGHTDTAMVTLDVTQYIPPLNLAPDAKNDSASLAQDTSKIISVLANDTDPENDPLTVSGITGNPAHGGVVINANNTVTYTPVAGYAGVDSFIYEISDGQGNHDTATVSLTITAAPTQNLNLTGSKSGDLLEGGSGNDTIDGDRGDDTMTGGNGNDKLYGDYDNDLISGGAGNDTIEGGKGNNTVIGGEGADVLISGYGGNDRFIYQHLSDAGDLIQGFNKGNNMIDLHALMVEIGYAGSNPAADGNLVFAPAAGNDLQVYVDTDGAGGAAAVLLLTLDNVKGLTALTLGVDYVI